MISTDISIVVTRTGNSMWHRSSPSVTNKLWSMMDGVGDVTMTIIEDQLFEDLE